MKTALLLSTTALLFCANLTAQIKKPETIFITKNEEQKRDGEKHYFGQLSVSFPIRSNPYRSEYDYYTDDDGNDVSNTTDRNYSVLDHVYPDGINIHYGLGLHYHKWVGISTNVGIDWIATEKLVSTPVYAALFFSPQLWEKTNIYLQGGVGHTFALGRGNLSGTYTKYRLGANFNNELTIFLEINQYGFPLYEMNPAGSINVGIAAIDLF